ncbi:MAG: hypothetical protein ACW96X_08840 [Promethearchaeota archaeon]|jgi:hypothetical protein
MEEFKQKYSREYKYLTSKFNDEIQDIQYMIEKEKIFIGDVKGIVKINYANNIPDSFQLIHLNRALIGIIAIPDRPSGSTLSFNFKNTSIYKFVCEFEYIRAYSKYQNLKIESIELNIANFLRFKDNQSEKNLGYNHSINREWQDIKRSLGILRLFSSPSPITVEYSIAYTDLNIVKKGSGEFSSVYKLFSEISNLREYKKSNIVEEIKMKIFNLDDSSIHIREDLFKRRDDEALTIY